MLYFLPIILVAILIFWISTVIKQQKIPTKYLAIIVFVIGALIRLIYAIETPTFYAPDEQAHFKHIKYLAEHKELPIQTSKTGAESNDWEYYQPPLYYLISALVYSFTSNFTNDTSEQIVTLRALSIAFWMINVFLAYRILQRLELTQPAIMLGVLTVFCLLPTYTFLSAMVNNDTLLVTVGLLLTYWLTQFRKTLPWAFFAGIILAAGIYTKLSAVVYVVCFCLFLMFTWLKDRSHLSKYLLCGGLSGIIVFVLFVPWVIRNLEIYGSASGLHVANIPVEWNSTGEMLFTCLRYLIYTFWSASGIYNNIKGDIFPKIGTLFFLFIMASLLIQWYRDSFRFNKEPIFLSLFFMLLLNFLLTLKFGYDYGQCQGRFLYPSLFLIGLFLSLGSKALPIRRNLEYFILFFLVYALSFQIYSLTMFSEVAVL